MRIEQLNRDLDALTDVLAIAGPEGLLDAESKKALLTRLSQVQGWLVATPDTDWKARALKAEAAIAALRAFVRQHAELASHSNAEWTAYAGVASGQAAYRSGMAWAFHRVEDFMGPKSL